MSSPWLVSPWYQAHDRDAAYTWILHAVEATATCILMQSWSGTWMSVC